MGIPSYFSYIVKNHPEILEKFINGSFAVNNLYMDCNSIIYDCFYAISEEDIDEHIAKTIIANTIAKIAVYISIINPTTSVIISFDGVAPVAKLEQQRTRRYKSWFQTLMTNKLFKRNPNKWSTTAITPGTSFMKLLNKEVSAHFNGKGHSWSGPKIIVSTSDEPGEGEHKIFQHIRDNKCHSEQTTVIYGLDADLIMLSINHIPHCKQIYLFRETPEFIKSINSSLEPNDNYILNIPLLADNIVVEMDSVTNASTEHRNRRLYDYIFLCFLLGNDFMPHFPAVNIRTGGIDKLMSHYRATMGKSDRFITKGDTIVWKNFRLLIQSLAKCESDYIIAETIKRDKHEHRFTNQDVSTPEKAYDKFQSIPCYERSVEKHIAPAKDCWEHRYYTTLFDISPDPDRIRQICINYMEGLEWTLKYYNTSCADWRWKYNYNYPPLLTDLLKHLPYFNTQFIKPNTHTPVSQHVQLCYVLPKHSLSLLPYKIYNMLQSKYASYYPEYCEFVWCYCKYFWEAHVDLPHISIEELERVVK